MGIIFINKKMKFVTLLLIATVSAIKIDGLPKVGAPAAGAPATAAAKTGKAAPLTWNYKSTGGHPGVNRLPNPPKTPVVAPFRLGGDGPVGKRTGTLNTPLKG